MADAQQAQLVFLIDEGAARRIYLREKSFLPVTLSGPTVPRKRKRKPRGSANACRAGTRATRRYRLPVGGMQVVAPADSVLEVLSVKVGDVLPANREAATLILTGSSLGAGLRSESWLGLIKLSEHVRVRVDSFPGKDFDGVVEQINRQAEFTRRATCKLSADRIKQVFGVKIRYRAMTITLAAPEWRRMFIFRM